MKAASKLGLCDTKKSQIFYYFSNIIIQTLTFYKDTFFTISRLSHDKVNVCIITQLMMNPLFHYIRQNTETKPSIAHLIVYNSESFIWSTEFCKMMSR